MQPKFTNFVYHHDCILGFTEYGDVWEFYYDHAMDPRWRFVCHGPMS